MCIRSIRKYLDKGYIIFMDNYYTSPYLFWELKRKDTGAVGTVRLNRRGFPDGIVKPKLKKPGESKIMSYDDKMVALKIYDRKVLTLMSTVYNASFVDTGKKHHQTKEPIKKPRVMTQYNKHMGGVDANDQLLKYSHFSRWWKKVFFRLMNVCMVNALALMKSYKNIQGQQYRVSQTEFRLCVVRQLLIDAGFDDSVTAPVALYH